LLNYAENLLYIQQIDWWYFFRKIQFGTQTDQSPKMVKSIPIQLIYGTSSLNFKGTSHLDSLIKEKGLLIVASGKVATASNFQEVTHKKRRRICVNCTLHNRREAGGWQQELRRTRGTRISKHRQFWKKK
jgi:hypothetical protein